MEEAARGVSDRAVLVFREERERERVLLHFADSAVRVSCAW